MPVVLVVALALLAATQLRPGSRPAAGDTDAQPVAPRLPPTTDLGVVTGPLSRDEYRAWDAGDLASVGTFEEQVHKHANIVMWYDDWTRAAPDPRQLRDVAMRGSIPEITWEPWDYRKGLFARQAGYTLQSIIDGRHDAYIATWARAVAAYGGVVRLRFAQEMNGTWYPWAELANGNHPGDFVAAWRHVHDVFDATGATNVDWVWAPFSSVTGVPASLYPGDDYVDYIGLSGFNGGSQLKWEPWRSAAAVFGPALSDVRRMARSKAVELSEVGCSEHGGSKAAWIAGLFAFLSGKPEITSLIWFDVNKESDWNIDSSPAARSAFAAGAGGARYR
jgi:beta-mannanase